MKQIILLSFTLLLSNLTFSQNYQLVWEDNFDGTSLDSSKWNVEERVGIWNTGGNSEFQHYKAENVNVGDDGEGNSCLILTAKKEDYNGYKYTSGKIDSKGKVAFRRGKLEAMIKIPDLANGLWPAFWTLGNVNKGWPDRGEIDVLEMGHAAGIEQGKQNSFIGSHLFWGPYPRDYGEEYIAPYDLSTGYFKHTVVWDEEKIATYFNDASQPYFVMGIDGDETEEYRDYQHYVIFNLAVGGSVPGIYNEAEITANFPANMYVDWVRIYQEENKEDITETELAAFGNFGLFEEDPNVEMNMVLDFDLIEKKSALATIEEKPFTGDEVLAYQTESGTDFELKLESAINRNMINYSEGTIQFYIKTDIEDEIQIGVSDWSGNSTFTTLDKGIKRDNKWQIANFNFATIADEVDLTKLKDMFILKGQSSNDGILAIDEIIYKETAPVVTGVYGIYTDNTNITDQFEIDNVNGNIFNWSNTVAFNEAYSAYDGEQVLAFKSSGSASWWGFGIHSEAPLNLSTFADGYLHFSARTESSNAFSIGIESQNGKGEIEIKNGNYDFVNNGMWHQIVVPISQLTAQGLDLTSITIILKAAGSSIGNLAIDNVYFSNSDQAIENPAICYPVSLSLSPDKKTMQSNKTQKFTASAKDQYNNSTDAYVEWFSDGGTITENGVFTPTEEGEYLVWATLNELSDTAAVIVEKANAINALESDIKYYIESETLYISGYSNQSQITISDFTGRTILKRQLQEKSDEIPTYNLPKNMLIVNIVGSKNKNTFRILK